MLSLSPYVFVIIYLIVDIIYVSLSKPVYNQAVKNISGESIPLGKSGFWIAALIAYVSMAVAWLLLVVPTVYYMIGKGYTKWVAGLVAGIAYGLAVYAVFNGTLYTMFVGWDRAIMVRDMIWGISWATILTIIFAVTRI